MPMDNRMLATTISIRRKGRKIKNPISKAVFNSLIIKAGIRMDIGTLLASEGLSVFDML